MNDQSQPLPAPVTFTAQQLSRARQEAQQTERRVIDTLQEHSGLDSDAFVAALGASLHYTPMTMLELHALTPAFDLLSFSEALQHECVAFRDGDSVLLAFADPFNARLREWAGERIKSVIEWRLVHHADLVAYLNRYEESTRAIDSATLLTGGVVESTSDAEELSLRVISEDTSPVVKLVHSTLYDALKSEVSDIHLEPAPQGLVIKYRLDGVLVQVGAVQEAGIAEQVISRIKVMSELDIAERRIPQDGRFKVSMRGREVDFRVSIMPGIHGEGAVLRILDKQALADHVKGLTLEHLGFDAAAMRMMRKLFREPYGMLLVTGPTGSGKTTTLYAALSEINNGHDKIITIEDPVEYQLPGILQIPVNEKKGLTFARGLRSILRHDPDKIMVGEIRDQDTAQIAIQSALTGHLVFTTVHANNVFDVMGRFTHMGVDPYSFVAALNGILAQRLIRIICPHCAETVMPEPEVLRESGIDPIHAQGYTFRHGRGCGQCRGAGFKGRRGIAEVLLLNDEMRELIIERAPIRAIKDLARRQGMCFLRDAALELVKRGETTLQEANRVTFVD